MPKRLAALLPLLVGALLAGALLVPEPDLEALEAQGLGRLLGTGRDGTPPLLEELDDFELARPALAIRLRRAGDDVALEGRPLYARALDSALNVANAARAERGQSPVARAEAREAAAHWLDLRLVREDHELYLDARLSERGAARTLTRRGPWTLPSRLALVPPLVAILIALALRRTVGALFCGIWIGAVILRAEGGLGWGLALFAGLWDVLWVYLRGELLDSFRIEIMGFVVALLAMVGVMTRGGGVQGLVDVVLRFARSARSTLCVSFGMGCLIFFDDYANCLIVGTTMRPLTDRLRISREKLAYVVDSTAAPIAGLSLFSTWIAFEVSTIAPHLPGAGITENPYAVFLQTLPFRYYCLLTLGFVLINVLLGRDFGPMRAAERRARRSGELVREGGTPMASAELTSIEVSDRVPPRWRNSAIPIATVVVVTLLEIFRQGGGYGIAHDAPEQLLSLEGWTEILFEGGGAGPLFVASSLGLAAAAFLVGSNLVRVALAAGAAAAALAAPALEPLLAGALPSELVGYAAAALPLGTVFGAIVALQRLAPIATRRPHLEGAEIARAAGSSTRALGFAIIILLEAWMIGQVCQDISTADYLVALTAGAVTAVWLPVLLFTVACLVSFATGTSWGTMSILLPNVVALAAAVGATHPIGSLGLVLVCLGAVLEGSIFGDHCSPISDTTVLSSVSAASDHIDHVRTQAPYALVAALFAIGVGYLPTLLLERWSLVAALASGLGLWTALLWVFGRTPAE